MGLATTLLAQSADGSWYPGIGDPSPLGWATVAAYVLATYTCYRAYRAARARRVVAPATLWALFTAAGVFQTLNKQLDLLSLFTVTARQMAIRDGWYEQRHTLQITFIVVGVVVALLSMLALIWIARRHLADFWLSLLGAALLGPLIVARASSFHQVDVFLHTGTVHMSWVLELAGIALVSAGALRYARRSAAGGPPRLRESSAQ